VFRRSIIRLSGPDTEEASEGLGKLRGEYFQNLCSSPKVIEVLTLTVQILLLTSASPVLTVSSLHFVFMRLV
jgi:hypothetical protein